MTELLVCGKECWRTQPCSSTNCCNQEVAKDHRVLHTLLTSLSPVACWLHGEVVQTCLQCSWPPLVGCSHFWEDRRHRVCHLTGLRGMPHMMRCSSPNPTRRNNMDWEIIFMMHHGMCMGGSLHDMLWTHGMDLF